MSITASFHHDSKRISIRVLSVLFVVASFSLGTASEHDAREDVMAAKILGAANFEGGLIVHLGCGDGRLTAAFDASDGRVVHGLDINKDRIAECRELLHSLGRYGPVSVEWFDGMHLPYSDNLVDLVVVSAPFSVAKEEILRVLSPGGKAIFLDPHNSVDHSSLVKPWPKEYDTWQHFLYDASGNAVSKDLAVAPPKHLQWNAGPRWSRSHETDMSLTALVSSGGRLFHTIDEGPIGIHETPKERRRLPDKCSLVARDAFNGIVLWKRPLPDWGSAAWDENRWRWDTRNQLWSSPLTLPRRLIAIDDRVYVTLGFRACVSELDAATGKTLREFPQTNYTEEMLCCNGILIARVRSAPKTGGAQESILAIDLVSGNTLWKREVGAVADLTLACRDGRICFYNTRQLIALDLETGKTLWQSPEESPPKKISQSGTLVITDDVVLFAQGRNMRAFSLVDGKQLWSTKTNTSFRGMPDVFVVDDLAWVGTMTTTGINVATGEVARKLSVEHIYTGGHHSRCYRGKATERYLLWSKRGVEFLDLDSEDHRRHDWVRGTCRYGMLPANGLLYAPPHPCFCYPGVKMNGFLALSGKPERDSPATGENHRLEPGPVYSEPIAHGENPNLQNEWPTYRHDNARSGFAPTTVSATLRKKWTTELHGKLSPPVIAEGKLFLSQIDSHQVTCLDAAAGGHLWSYTADGKVDSPPTIHRGRAIFGCTDGSVYCLRASDGQLIWRFLARPTSRRIMSYGALESAWPVHGSVLVENNKVYFAAGRSSFLDGGMNLFALDVKTGKIRHKNHLEGPEPDLSIPSNRAHDMEGAKNDILVSKGRKLFMLQNVFDLEWNQLEAPRIAPHGAREMDLHLVATGGFLDDSGFDRLYWMHARRWPGLYVADDTAKAGQILVFDDVMTYGLHLFNQKFSRSPYFEAGSQECELFADKNSNEPVLTEAAARRERGSMTRKNPPVWSVDIPVRARAMVVTKDHLFLAGPPDEIDPDDPYGAFEGRRGGSLWAVATADGKKLAEHKLDSPPVFDGLAAADGSLFLCTKDGRVSCWE